MRILGIGITSGMLLLFSPAVLLVIAAWLTWMYIYRKVPATDIALALLVALIVIAPWLARNYAVFHRFVFIRDNFGLELAISNSDCATAWYENNLQSRCFVQQHPNMSSGESARVLALGEVEYNRQKLYDAVMWITRNPGRFTDLTRERIVAFWTGGLFSLGVSIGKFLSTVMIVLGICGLWKLRYSCRGSAAFLGLGLLFFAPPYYLVQFTDRYSFPILWATFIPGTYVLLELLAGRFIVGNKRRQAGQSPDDKFIAVE